MKKTYIVLLVIFLAALGFYACGNGSDSGGYYGGVNDSGGTIAGVDANNDGVRDDVADYIIDNYGEDEKATDLLMEYAREQQALMVAENKEEAVSVAHSDYAIDCIFYLYPVEEAIEMTENIDGQVANSEARVTAMIKADSYLGGEIFKSFSDEGLNSICN